MYVKITPKLVLITPWVALCVNLVGPYTLKDKDRTAIAFMCVTMINLATSWFEIVELLAAELTQLEIPTMNKKGNRGKNTHDTKSKQTYFDKSSVTVGSLVYRCLFSHYPQC